MGRPSLDRFFGGVFIGGMVVLLVAMLVLMAMEVDAWVIIYLTIVTGSVVGMTAGMVLLIKAFRVEDPNGS